MTGQFWPKQKDNLLARRRHVQPPFDQSVFHPSDFSEASENAFAQALAVALIRQTPFTSLPVGSDYLGEDEWTLFPALRETLERWRLHRSGDPVGEIVRGTEEDPADLIVMATAGCDGIVDALRGTLAERVLRRAPCPRLAVPSQ